MPFKNSVFAIIVSSAIFAASTAHAAPCGANGNPVVYVAGTVKPYVSAIARALYNDPNPITIVYKGITSCLGIDAVLNSTPISGTGSYFDPGSSTTGNEVMCDLPVPEGGTLFADIGSSDVFAPTCFSLSGGLPPSVQDNFGPVQAMGFVVPTASTEHSISAAAAYYIYGLGAGAANITPWKDPTFVFKRNEASGTSLLIGRNIALDAIKWKNSDPSFSSAMITALTTSTNPAATLGVLAKTDITDTLSLQLRMLAFKQTGQSCGYYPDQSETSKDKQNVRDGHYALWGPTHFYVKVNTSGNITNPNVARVIGILTGTSVAPGGLDLIQVDEVNNLVPSCAMKVKRTIEGGSMTPVSPPNSCSCYYDQLSTGKNGCTPCTSTAACPASAPVCSFGFCEAT
ncbi:MAG: hypothetical protein ABI183_05035 [Polyangiaceae bacterium]